MNKRITAAAARALDDRLARGHAITPGRYFAGGPVGTVSYYAKNQELPVGRPLTVNKANIARYAG